MESKYYHTQTQQEWDWLLKHFNLVNEPKGYGWPFYGKDTVVQTLADTTNNWICDSKQFYSSFLGITDFIEVLDLMKEKEMKDKIIFTEKEKKEFDDLKSKCPFITVALNDINNDEYEALNVKTNSPSKEKEFVKAWYNPDLIEVKEEPKFTYELKPEFKKMLNTHSWVYLGLDGKIDINKRYYTQSEWQRVDDNLKVIFDRVEEK